MFTGTIGVHWSLNIYLDICKYCNESSQTINYAKLYMNII